MIKRALITGITGQDGSYLAEFLLDKGYEVHGLVRRSSVHGTERIDHLLADDLITLHDGDLSDSTSIVRVVSSVQPDEIYNLAAQSHVGVSFDAAEYTGDVDALGVLRILEAVHMLGLDKTCKIYQASTSELYGKVEEVPQNEDTPFHPFSPYAVAKQYGFGWSKNIGMHMACSRATAFCLTMNRSVVERISLHARLPRRPLVFRLASKTTWNSVILTL